MFESKVPFAKSSGTARSWYQFSSTQDAVASVPTYRDILSIGAVINFARDSPKRLLWFEGFQHDGTTAVRPYCPTRWVLRQSALKSVLSNYEELHVWMFFEEVSCDKSEAGANAAGFASQLGSFQTCFNLASVDKIFTPIGTVNQAMQAANLHLQQACELLQNLKDMLQAAIGINLQNFGLQ